MGSKIGFAGTDARTFLGAYAVSTTSSGRGGSGCSGLVVRGTRGMREFVRIKSYPIEFIPTETNSVDAYAKAIIYALRDGRLDYIIPMPETLLFKGLVDRVVEAGFGTRIAGLTRAGSFIEGDKIECKKLCREYGIPVADEWEEVDARDYRAVLKTCLLCLEKHGGAVPKYPYSAAGKGSRIILSPWEIREVYDRLVADYGKEYEERYGKRNPWPLLVESRIAGVEITFTVLVDQEGNFRILPTSLDYPERFPGVASKENPITGGMCSISPHPMETRELFEMVAGEVMQPLIDAMRRRKILRPCVIYPGCMVMFDSCMQPKVVRVCEINIRSGEPDSHPSLRLLRNPAELFEAMCEGRLDEVVPEIRENQISMSLGLVVGPGGPQGQKGYPWSCTRKERMEIDFSYLEKKQILFLPSAMDYNEEFLSDGTRVAYLLANAAARPAESRENVAKRLSSKLLQTWRDGRVRVIPREDPAGNRLAVREDLGVHFELAANLFCVS